MAQDGLRYEGASEERLGSWECPPKSIAFDEAGIQARLLALGRPCFAVREGGRIGLSNEGHHVGSGQTGDGPSKTLAWTHPLPIDRLGDGSFRTDYGTQFSYYAGAMANGIASEEMVIALGREGFLGSFGAAGLVPARVREGIARIQAALPEGRCCQAARRGRPDPPARCRRRL